MRIAFHRRLHALPMRDECGSVALIVATSLVVVFGAAALSIDAGGAWTLRRALVGATDATALAAAHKLATSGPAVCAEATAVGTASAVGGDAEAVFQANQPGGSLESFGVQPFGGTCLNAAGRVVVRASRSGPAFFARVFGLKDVRVRSTSVAQWGGLHAITGLRPIGVCVTNPHIAEWQALRGTPAYDALAGTPEHPAYAGAGVVHRVYFEKTSPDACSSKDIAGNWGWIDFTDTNTPNGADALGDQLLNGYDGTVTVDDCNNLVPGDQDCAVETGAVASTKSALDELLCPAGTTTDRCRSFPIVVYDSATGSGSTAAYNQVWFLGVVLRGYAKITGSPTPNSYFDFEFVELNWPGVSGPDMPTAAVRGVQLCGVDADVRCDV